MRAPALLLIVGVLALTGVGPAGLPGDPRRGEDGRSLGGDIADPLRGDVEASPAEVDRIRSRGTSRCLSDLGFPLELELNAPETARPGRVEAATLTVRPRQPAERVEVALRPSTGAEVAGPARLERSAIGTAGTGPLEVRARLLPGALRGTVDLVATAWIDGRPISRGITWNLVAAGPERGRVVPRPGRLAVREHAVGRGDR